MKTTLPELFSRQGDITVGPDEYDQARMSRESVQSFSFFDPERDAISFHHLGLSQKDQQNLVKSGKELNQDNQALLLAQYMVRQQLLQDEFPAGQGPKESALDFFKKASTKRPAEWNYPNAYRVPAIAPQLLALNLDTDSYAEEYIVVVVADAYQDSKLDKDAALGKLQVLFGESKATAGVSSSAERLKGRMEELESGISMDPYFSFRYSQNGIRTDALIQGYRMRPIPGGADNDLLLEIEGTARMVRDIDKEGIYQFRSCKLVFPELPALRPSQLWLTLRQKQSSDYGIPLFAGPVASPLGGGKWASEYTHSEDLMAYEGGGYVLPAMHMSISPDRKRALQDYQLEHLLMMEYTAPGMAHPWKLAFGKQQFLGPNQVTHSPVPKWMIPVAVLIVLSLCLIWLVIKIRKARPTGLRLVGSSLTETYMSLDSAGLGRQSTPYRVWEGAEAAQVGIRLDLKVERKGLKGSPLFRHKVEATIMDQQVPVGFEVFLTAALGDHNEKSKGFGLVVSEQKKKATLPLFLNIRQQDLSIHIDKPTPVRVAMQFRLQPVVGSFLPSMLHTTTFVFHIGPDLGDLWMGFDPGTSGTVTAVGTSALNVTVCTDQHGESIEPSVVSFNRKEKFTKGLPVHEVPHLFGTEAARWLHVADYAHFQSMKKLLGFKDVKEIHFESGQTLMLTGKELATLLVKGVYSHARKFLERPAVKGSLQSRGNAIEPTRAVVAIPNNFTLPKIRDMVDCIAAAGKFREIRYIHEAEAVLFYYLSRFSKLCPEESAPARETVLVFDMGGATINASVVSVRRENDANETENYHVSLDAKIGYGIGGDTIDYCLVRHLLDSAGEFPQLKSINLKTHRAALSRFAFELKREIIANYKLDAETLITSFKLNDIIHDHFGVKLNIDERTSGYYADFKRKPDGIYPLLFGGLLREIVYDSIMDAVREVLDLAGRPRVDRVIFSGRSTAFPMVGKGVLWAVNGQDGKVPFLKLGLEESKTAVAIGCCWYGINRKAIHMANTKTSSSIGVRQTHSADGSRTKYLELVSIGKTYPLEDGISGMLEGTKEVNSDFALDGGHVSFLQVMGKDAEGIISRNEKHKFSNLIRIPLASRSTLIGARVWDYDLVQCVVRQEDGSLKEVHASVADQEIAEANEEHYTWTVN